MRTRLAILPEAFRSLKNTGLILLALFAAASLQAQGPGAVNGNLQLWLRADLGVEEAASDEAELGDAVLNWLDQSGQGNDFTNDFGSAPDYVSNNGRLAIDFSGGSEYLRSASIVNGTGARSMLVFVQPSSLSSSSANNCAFQLAPNESSGQGYSIFLEEPNVSNSTGLACRVSGNRIMDYATSTSQPTLLLVQNGASENVTQTEFYANGVQITDQVSAGAVSLNTSSLGCIIGGFSSGADNNPESGFDFNGDITEVIVYDKELSGTERNSIETYFNIRYGVSIPVANHDYYSHSSFEHDIAGIGRDQANQLFTQDSSQSINSTAILNISNPSALDDGDYLVWGHDSGTTSLVTDNIPGTIQGRTERIWRIEETNEVGTTTLRFYFPGVSSCGGAGNAGNLKLLVDGTDTDFSDATIIDATTYSNDSVYFTGVNLSDGDHFTLAISGIASPADISDGLVLWLKASCGVEEAASDPAEIGDNVLNWLDQSFGGAGDVTNSIGSAPVYNTVNGDTVIDFSGGSAYLHGPSVLSGDGARTMIVVAQPTSLTATTSNNCAFALAPNNTTGTGYGLFIEEPSSTDGTGLSIRVAGNRIMDYTSSITSPTIYQVSGDSGINVSATNFYANGQFLTQQAALNDATLNTNTLGTIIGGFATGGVTTPSSSFDFNGYIHEIIVFSREVSCSERAQLNIYLEAEYGIELDYFDETSTGSNGAATEVDGILKRYGSFADSTSARSDGVQLDNVSFLTDVGDALYLGSNGSSGINISDIPGGIEARVSRAWFSDYTSCNSNTGNVTLSFDLTGTGCNSSGTPQTASNYRLLTSASSTFSSASSFSGASINGTAVEFTIDVSNLNDVFFTVATTDTAVSPIWYQLGGPADITNGLVLWLQSDCGIEEAAGDDAENGDDVLFWRDQSGNGNDVTNDYGGAPSYVESSGIGGVDFSGGSDYLRGSAVISGTTGRTMFVVLNANSIAAANGNSVLSLAPNDNTGSGYSLSLETPGGSNGLAIRVSGNKVMNYTAPTGASTIISTQSDDGENVTDTEFFVNGESVIEVQNSSSAALNTNTIGMILGGWSTNGDLIPETAWNYDGTIHEVIVFDRELSCSERQQVEAYLAGKFSINLFYETSENIGDNGINTDQAVVEESSTSATSSAVTISNSTFINDCSDTLWFAHNNGSGTVYAADDPDMSGLAGDSVQRWGRTWYALFATNETDPLNVDVTFDFDDFAGSSSVSVSGSDYRIITSASPWSYATTVAGPTVDFAQNTVSFTIDVNQLHQRNFTLATTNAQASPLPVELLQFEAKPGKDLVDLFWQTASETNSDYFSVQRSANAQQWTEIGTVQAAGHSREVLTYQHTDNEPLEGKSYYRLKQVDFDGTSEFSGIRVVHFNDRAESRLRVFPNPTRDQLHVEASAEALRTLRFTTQQGIDLLPQLNKSQSADGRLTLDLSGIPSGIYLLISPFGSAKVVVE